MKIFSVFFLLLFIHNSFGNTYVEDNKDVANFIEKRDQCDHLRGEISGEPDIDNARNLNAELDKYCKGTDQALAQLKAKYKNNATILKKLAVYDENVEPSSNNNEISYPFEKYSVSNYEGDIKIPNGYIQKDDAWFDNLGKVVNPVAINFSGKYYIGLHSCGSSCRYYTLNDLAEDKDYSNDLERFTSSPDKNEDNNYFIELFYQPDSNLLVARYYKNIDSEEYQDCYFLLQENKINKLEHEKKCPIFN